MKQIDIECISNWVLSSNQQYASPAAIATNCPDCSRQVVFTTRRRNYDPFRDALSCSSECPACMAIAHFWVSEISARTDEDPERELITALYMMPSGASCLDLSTIRDQVPDSLHHYCTSLLDVYKSGNLTATNILMQATLESLFSSLLPIGNSRSSLPRLIQDTCKSIDLAEPLNRLTASIATEGDLAVLFKNNEHTSQESADAMMVLLEQLITWLYVLPAEFETLEKRFAELRQSQEASESDSHCKAA